MTPVRQPAREGSARWHRDSAGSAVVHGRPRLSNRSAQRGRSVEVEEVLEPERVSFATDEALDPDLRTDQRSVLAADAIVVAPVLRVGREDLPGHVVAVLLGVEHPPAVRGTAWGSRAPRRPSAVGSPLETWMPVISLSPSFWKPAVPSERRVDASPTRRGPRRGCAPAGSPVRVVGSHVEHVGGVERVALGVQRVARVLDERPRGRVDQNATLSKPVCAGRRGRTA